MKRIGIARGVVWAGTVVWAMVSVCQAVPETSRARAARVQVTEGVRAIDAEGLPGPVMCVSEDAFAIGQSQNWDGTKAFAGAGAFYGEGRAVYLGHPAYLTGAELADTGKLIKNLVAWLSEGVESPRLVAFKNRSIEAKLKRLGFSPTFISDWAEIKRGDIVATIDFPIEHAKEMCVFVRAGGRLLGAGLGWGWKQFATWHSEPTSLGENFPDNQVIGPMGILMGDQGTPKPTGYAHYPVLAEYPELCYSLTAFERAQAGEIEPKQDRKQCLKTIALTVDALPSTAPQGVRSAVVKLVKSADAKKVPSRERPIGPNDLAAKTVQILKKNAWQGALEEVWPADPAHVSYPGAVKEGWTGMTRRVKIDCAETRWHSTGLYAPAGAPITITLPEGAEKLGLSVRIGTTSEDITTAQEVWKRAPVVTMGCALKKRETTLASPYGGLVYIDVPMEGRSLAGAAPEVTIAGAIRSPRFILGETTNEAFAREANETKAPMGELEGRNLVITLPTKALCRIKDAESVMLFWDMVLDGDRSLAALPRPSYKERFCGDLQLESGFMHNGYPMMFHLSEDGHEEIVDIDKQLKGEGWGYYHEMGHNHQDDAWTPEGTGEVTVNIFTTYVISRIARQNFRERRFEGSSGVLQAERLRKWVRNGKRHEDWKDDYFLALELYLRLAEVYGYEAYAKTFAAYRQPGFKRPTTNTEKWDTFARVMSEVTGDDLGSVFAVWNLPMSPEGRAACRRYRPAPAALVMGVE